MVLPIRPHDLLQTATLDVVGSGCLSAALFGIVLISSMASHHLISQDPFLDANARAINNFSQKSIRWRLARDKSPSPRAASVLSLPGGAPQRLDVLCSQAHERAAWDGQQTARASKPRLLHDTHALSLSHVVIEGGGRVLMLRCGRGGHEIVNVSFHEGSHSHCPANLCLLLRLLAGDRRPPVRRRLRSSQGSGGVPPRAPWTREGPAFRVHTHAWPPFADGGRRLAVDSLCPTDEIIALCITPAHAATDSSPRRM